MNSKTKRRLFFLFLCGLTTVCAVRQWDSSATAQGKVDFVRDIQPIFQASCTPCHFGEKPKADLRLNSKSITMKQIVPGKSAESRLIHRVLGLNGEKRMPLGGQPLSAEQIELLKRWIDEGAQWPDSASVESGVKKHWAFLPPVRPAVPEVKNKAWVRNPIDAFILARLEKENLAPSPEADKITLLRRLSLDLIGLPPTPEEVDAFLADKSPNAYEKQVERLLASPHYGERWARHWLDAARYADSDGFEKDKMRNVWFYRDWVINALNRDLPYDQFIIEQIAGDLLPNATQEQKVATGFLRNSMINEEGGVDPEQFRMEAMFDRMDAIGKGILGLTIQCAQCHNHKYDPLKQEEYYQMFAFLNNSDEGSIVVYTPEEQMQRANILSGTREIEAKLREIKPDWLAAMNAWEDRVKNDQPEWQVIQPVVEDISTGGQKYFPLKDGSFLAQGYAPTKHRVKLQWKSPVQNITALRIEMLNDPNLPMHGPGRSPKGTFGLTDVYVEVVSAKDERKVEKIRLVNATADVNPPEKELDAMYFDKSNRRRVEGPIAFAIDDKDETAWGIDVGPGLRNVPRKAVFNFEKPITTTADTMLTIYLKQNHGGWNSDDNMNNNLGRFRLSITTAPNAVADPLPANVREILNIPRAQRTKAQLDTVFSYWRTTVNEWRDYNQQIAALWQKHPTGTSQLTMNERSDMRMTSILKRGDFLRPDRAVAPGVPAFLNPLPNGAPANRLTFAKWLVDRQAPTTARAAVNRLWQSYFGTGIVATSEDLGKQSEVPSHPELLDWLAVEFMEGASGRRGDGATNNPQSAIRNPQWSMKNVHRMIVTSATYRQSSKLTPQLLEKDPLNRLLARAPRFRVEGEIVRDIALAASGLLNPKVGGASVFPPSPEFLYLPPASYGPKNWYEDKGENRYRRGLYTFRYRSVPYPMLQTFDVPNGDISCVRRAKSNTPLQALTTLNETTFLEASRALALKTIKEGGATDGQKIEFAFRRVTSRKPSAQETAELLGLMKRQQERFITGELNPWNLATNDPDKPFLLPKGVTMEQLAAWTAVARVVLNLDEAITKE
ncbi:MAG TPA: PSD1 and planctomycete cytochrome C domain-containing protein [Blastocatellia bacterium]|nr:PSD1 and planctomycete cytochrome C domain-containing protein [Blastocatellia bacterium]